MLGYGYRFGIGKPMQHHTLTHRFTDKVLTILQATRWLWCSVYTHKLTQVTTLWPVINLWPNIHLTSVSSLLFLMILCFILTYNTVVSMSWRDKRVGFPHSHTISTSLFKRGYQEGVPYLGEFLTVSHDVGLDSNIYYSCFNIPKRREGHISSFSCYVNIFIWEGVSGGGIISRWVVDCFQWCCTVF